MRKNTLIQRFNTHIFSRNEAKCCVTRNTKKSTMASSKGKLVTVILTGGQSSRMQQDKALLMMNGMPLIRRVYDVSIACTDEAYIVTPWPERYQAALPADCRWLHENLAHQGPLLAFQQSLPQITADWILLLACDLPCLDAITIQGWIRDLENVPKDSIAYLAPQAKGWEALCGFYRTSCHLSLDKFVQAGGQSFQKWLQSEVVAPMPITAPHIFTNWNCPEDIQPLL
jgi:molybdenum cofactor guanylyltransferase